MINGWMKVFKVFALKCLITIKSLYENELMHSEKNTQQHHKMPTPASGCNYCIVMWEVEYAHTTI